MSFTSLLVHQITITNPVDTTDTDRYGNPVPGEESFDTVARMQPVTSAEDIVDRDTRITAYLVFLKPGTNVSALSTITWEGRSFRVHGEPRTFTGRRTAHHIELDAQEVLG